MRELPVTGAPIANSDFVVVEGLEVSIRGASNPIRVVEEVEFSIGRGEMLGLVGESGSGKSVTGGAISKLLPRALQQTAGSIVVDGIEISTLTERQMARLRGSLVSVIPQDPTTNLDPCYTLGHQIMDVLRAHGRSRREARDQALTALQQVRIPDPERRLDQYPHQVSGGMKQRVLIAMAICCGPKLLIADECTTALDATTQAQILDLLRTLSHELDMATIFTTHDLGVAREMCSRLAVMYAGQVVESGDLDTIFASPRHPYTEKLLSAIPSRLRKGLPGGIPGRVPQLSNLPSGCRFHPRCDHALEGTCTAGRISLKRKPERTLRCARDGELTLKGIYQ